MIRKWALGDGFKSGEVAIYDPPKRFAKSALRKIEFSLDLHKHLKALL